MYLPSLQLTRAGLAGFMCHPLVTSETMHVLVAPCCFLLLYTCDWLVSLGVTFPGPQSPGDPEPDPEGTMTQQQMPWGEYHPESPKEQT